MHFFFTKADYSKFEEIVTRTSHGVLKFLEGKNNCVKFQISNFSPPQNVIFQFVFSNLKFEAFDFFF
jgi:hypothetical protein